MRRFALIAALALPLMIVSPAPAEAGCGLLKGVLHVAATPLRVVDRARPVRRLLGVGSQYRGRAYNGRYQGRRVYYYRGYRSCR